MNVDNLVREITKCKNLGYTLNESIVKKQYVRNAIKKFFSEEMILCPIYLVKNVDVRTLK